jgi:2-polyprenyl-6-methoxyphenol hydroxylase-like FAD-dependent oxidoreductase
MAVVVAIGIGGLATALSLQALWPGEVYTILEQAPKVKEVRAGIGMGDNGVQICISSHCLLNFPRPQTLSL